MVKTSGDLEREFIETSRENTGKSLQEWLALVHGSGIANHNDIMLWLKRGHGLNHMQAQFVTGMHENGGSPVYCNDGLMDIHFRKGRHLWPIFDTMTRQIIDRFPGTQLISKKTYLSFTAVREFVAVSIRPKEIRLALDLGDKPFDDILQKSKVTGPMPRFSHMIIFTGTRPLDMDSVQASFYRTHSL